MARLFAVVVFFFTVGSLANPIAGPDFGGLSLPDPNILLDKRSCTNPPKDCTCCTQCAYCTDHLKLCACKIGCGYTC
nr:uncharacterized protein CTRU02_08003 [Colletotrichum truncatum]KAF6790483.1 hypothetical protein CTRU02_08003 [Colletotrichum truncatum]